MWPKNKDSRPIEQCCDALVWFNGKETCKIGNPIRTFIFSDPIADSAKRTGFLASFRCETHNNGC